MVLLWIITLPDRSEHLLAHPSVELTYTINLLTGVDGESRHGELLVLVLRIGTTHADELVPRETEQLWIATHILAEELLVEVVVTSWYRSVAGIQTAGTYQLESLVEGESLMDIVYQTLQVAECCVSLVAMIDILLDAKTLQQQHTTDTEQDLLLQTVLPVATIESVGDRLVVLRVEFVVCVEQIQTHTTNIHTPYSSMYVVVHIWHLDEERVAILIQLTFYR